MLSAWIKTLGAWLLLASVAHAQFQFFEHMFGGGGGGGGGGGRQGHQQAPQNVPSDSSRYQNSWESATCDKYLCPGTLACVHFPHHCPCPHADVEEKVELGEGSAVCISRGGYELGEAPRKIELARKGLL